MRAQAQGQLEAIDRSEPTLARRLDANPEVEWERIIAFKEFTYEGKVAQAEQEIAWAKRGLRLLDELGELDRPEQRARVACAVRGSQSRPFRALGPAADHYRHAAGASCE